MPTLSILEVNKKIFSSWVTIRLFNQDIVEDYEVEDTEINTLMNALSTNHHTYPPCMINRCTKML